MDQINTFYDLDTGVLQVLDLEYLLETFPEDAFTAKYKQLNTALTGLVSDYRYFTPLVTLVVWLVTPSPVIHVLFYPDQIEKPDSMPCSLVNFLPVTVKSKERMLIASQTIDKANG